MKFKEALKKAFTRYIPLKILAAVLAVITVILINSIL